MKIALVCSSGGHFLELFRLRDLWERHDRFWATLRGEDTEDLLDGERRYWAHQPTTRNIPNLLRNARLAWTVLRRERPDVVVSTGAAIAVPFLYVARVLGIPTVYIESLARTRDLSLTGKLVYPVSDRFLVQWPSLAGFRRRAVFKGQVL